MNEQRYCQRDAETHDEGCDDHRDVTVVVVQQNVALCFRTECKEPENACKYVEGKGAGKGAPAHFRP